MAINKKALIWAFLITVELSCIVYVSYELGKRKSFEPMFEKVNEIISSNASIHEYNANLSVIIDKDVAKILELAWNSYDVEYSFMLDGKIKDNIYYITEIKAKQISFANETMVRSFSDKTQIATLHSHPSGICWLSEQDKLTHNYNIENNSVREDQLTAVQCGEETFIFFYPDEYDKPIRWEII
jgi:hypothetical protein